MADVARRGSRTRVLASALLRAAVPASTNDLERLCSFRSSMNTSSTPGTTALQGWLPDPAGIFYSAQMGFFYNTFYRNPQAEWLTHPWTRTRLMPPND